MTPVWIFPAYPLLVIGPHAAVLAAHINGIRALDIIVAGWVFQGIGFLVSLMIYASFIYRLMTQKLPRESLRPGMFISVGPSGFTIAGVVNMGQILPSVVTDDFMGNGYLTGQVCKIASAWMGLWLWGLAFWFLIVSVGAHWTCVRDGRMTFAMTWYSYIFPNTGTAVLLRGVVCLLTRYGSAHNSNLRHRRRSQQRPDQSTRMCNDMPTDRRLDHNLLHYGASSDTERHSLAAETRGSGRRRLEGPSKREESMRSSIL
jgi:hypothetical protein